MAREHVTRRLADALAVLRRAQGTEVDVHDHAARALATCLRYRWAYVTQFDCGSSRVRVVGSWMDGRAGTPFAYDLAGTPCEHVVAIRAFVRIPERLTELFPGDRGLAKLGAQSYAGDVYFDADGAPAGHVFAVTDRSDGESDLARECTRLVTAWVGREAQHAALQESRARALSEARTDPLTLTRNRKAFDEDLASAFSRGDDLLLVAIDLDGFKLVNDTRGHEAGDRLLVRFTSALAARLRPDDRVYRLGGDEFGVLVAHAAASASRSVLARIALAVADVNADGYAEFGASHGFASTTEAPTVKELVALADERMYADKRRRKSAMRVRQTG